MVAAITHNLEIAPLWQSNYRLYTVQKAVSWVHSYALRSKFCFKLYKTLSYIIRYI